MTKSRFAWLIVPLTVALLAGCGSNRDSDEAISTTTDFGSNAAGVSFVGAGKCVECHQTISFSQELVTEYLGSKHVVHSSSINAASDSFCLDCHDPIGDGGTLEQYLDPADVPAEGLAAVGCENCHGAGGEHFGVGPIPNVNPDFNVCGECHNALPDSHIPHHPLADNIFDNYLRSNHADAPRDGNPCFRCHSDEGFRSYIDSTFQLLEGGGDADSLEAALAGVVSPTNLSQIQCRTCHDPHSGDLRTPATEDSFRLEGGERIHPVKFSSQFNLCTSCHQVNLEVTRVFSDEGTEDEEFEHFNYALNYNTTTGFGTPFHGTDGDPTDMSGRTIWDTHFADPDTGIAGYNINAADEKACTQCHDPHAASKFDGAQAIAEDWGNSDLFHGDYQDFPTFEFQSCARCHSGSEHIKWINGLEDWEIEGEEARVVGCVTCHDLTALNALGDGFDLGVRRDYPREEIVFPPFPEEENADSFLPIDPVRSTLDPADLGDDAFCTGCHLGRGGMGSVLERLESGATTSRNDNHHGYAASTRYGNMAKGGFEFEGRSYASKFEHVQPYDNCKECHDVHSGEVKVDECSACHVAEDGLAVETHEDLRDIRMIASQADYDGDGNTTEGIYYEIQGLWDLLFARMVNAGIVDPRGTVIDPIAKPDLHKAQYNLNFTDMFGDNFRDHGAFAHNPTYAIELLYDSLDEIDDSEQNDSVVTSFGIARDDEGHFDATAEPFRHWDLAFDEETQTFEDGAVSTRCAKCHSSAGYRAFLADDDIAASDLPGDTGGISAGLACDSCHFPALALRTAGDVTFPSGAVQSLGEPSNLCMECHQGRASKDDVDESIAENDFGFTNIHYYAAAASFFGTDVQGGYEYDGKAYSGQNTFGGNHDGVGFNVCTGCHMVEDSNFHDFKPDLAECVGCHGPSSSFETLGLGVGATYNSIQTLKGQLRDILIDEDVTFLDGYPYFSNIETAAELKGAYNWQVADKEPCGYIHNGDYIQQLLYDSVEDLGGTPLVEPRPNP